MNNGTEELVRTLAKMYGAIGVELRCGIIHGTPAWSVWIDGKSKATSGPTLYMALQDTYRCAVNELFDKDIEAVDS
jgi:hypothetical protein